MKFFYIKTDKSEGWIYSPDLADLAIRAQNAGHTISEIRDITNKRQGDYSKQFKF